MCQPCSFAAALVPGALGHEVSQSAALSGNLRIRHPSAVIQSSRRAHGTEQGWQIDFIHMGRTSRRIMQGEILVQPSKQRWLVQQGN